jgi:hypothetical protein
MGTKAPQDHKTKTTKKTTLEPKPIVITVRGVTATITRETLDDFDFLLDISALESTDGEAKSVSLMASVLLRLVGPQAARELSRSGREAGQRTTVEEGVKIIGEVFEALKAAGAVDPTGSPTSSDAGDTPS